MDGKTIEETIKIGDDGCLGCTIRCKKRTGVGERRGHGPEYETIFALGSSLGIGDLELITLLNYECNEMGIDTISAGGTIACAMDLFEDGIITKEDTSGIDLGFGSGDGLFDLIGSIASKRGFGSLLAMGSYRLADHFGHPEYSMSVNKQELAAYDPRVLKGMSLVFAQSNRGACHLQGGLTTTYELYGSPIIVNPQSIAGKGALVALCQNVNAYLDSLIGCIFAAPGVGSDVWARLVTASVFGPSGRSYTPQDLMEVGERIYNLERLFNQREGISPMKYRLPGRLLAEEVKDGVSRGAKLTWSEVRLMEEEYYEIRGWEDGVPTREKLGELGIL